jgi:hypothetical protein
MYHDGFRFRLGHHDGFSFRLRHDGFRFRLGTTTVPVPARAGRVRVRVPRNADVTARPVRPRPRTTIRRRCASTGTVRARRGAQAIGAGMPAKLGAVVDGLRTHPTDGSVDHSPRRHDGLLGSFNALIAVDRTPAVSHSRGSPRRVSADGSRERCCTAESLSGACGRDRTIAAAARTSRSDWASLPAVGCHSLCGRHSASATSAASRCVGRVGAACA